MVKTVASIGQGVEDVMAALDQHVDWLHRQRHAASRRENRATEEIHAIALAAWRSRMEGVGSSPSPSSRLRSSTGLPIPTLPQTSSWARSASAQARATTRPPGDMACSRARRGSPRDGKWLV